MSHKRKGPATPITAAVPAPIAPTAAITETPAVEPTPEKPAPSVIWKVVGVAAVGVALIVAYGVSNHIQRRLSDLKQEGGQLGKELRIDLSRLSQSYVGLVKKDEHTTRIRSVWDTIKELRADRSDLTIMKERCSVLAELFKTSEAERKELTAQVHKLRQTSRVDEEKKELGKQIREIRARIAQIEARPNTKADLTGEEDGKP